jgi:hypothetical protein
MIAVRDHRFLVTRRPLVLVPRALGFTEIEDTDRVYEGEQSVCRRRIRSPEAKPSRNRSHGHGAFWTGCGSVVKCISILGPADARTPRHRRRRRLRRRHVPARAAEGVPPPPSASLDARPGRALLWHHTVSALAMSSVSYKPPKPRCSAVWIRAREGRGARACGRRAPDPATSEPTASHEGRARCRSCPLRQSWQDPEVARACQFSPVTYR